MSPWAGRTSIKATARGIQFTLAVLDLTYRGKLKEGISFHIFSEGTSRGLRHCTCWKGETCLVGLKLHQVIPIHRSEFELKSRSTYRDELGFQSPNIS